MKSGELNFRRGQTVHVNAPDIQGKGKVARVLNGGVVIVKLEGHSEPMGFGITVVERCAG